MYVCDRHRRLGGIHLQYSSSFLLVTLIISNSLRVRYSDDCSVNYYALHSLVQRNISDVRTNNCCHHILFSMLSHMDRQMMLGDISGFLSSSSSNSLINSFQIYSGTLFWPSSCRWQYTQIYAYTGISLEKISLSSFF